MPLINNPAAVTTLTVGGRVFTDLANLKILTGYVNGAAAGNTAFRLLNATAGYSVPVGKTFIIQAVRFLTSTDGAIFFLYCDNDTGFASATAQTNPVFMNGSSLPSQPMLTKPTATVGEVSWYFAIPTGKFPSAYNAAGGAVSVIQIFGYEV